MNEREDNFAAFPVAHNCDLTSQVSLQQLCNITQNQLSIYNKLNRSKVIIDTVLLKNIQLSWLVSYHLIFLLNIILEPEALLILLHYISKLHNSLQNVADYLRPGSFSTFLLCVTKGKHTTLSGQFFREHAPYNSATQSCNLCLGEIYHIMNLSGKTKHLQLHVCYIMARSSRKTQNCSQPHHPGWAKVPLSSFFLKFLSIFPNFPQTLLIFFLTFALRAGKSPTREGPGYATGKTSMKLTKAEG